MAIKRRDGWVIVQSVLSEDEYKNIFAGRQKESGLSESSYIRVCLELPPKQGKKRGAKRGRRSQETHPKAASSVTAGVNNSLPFVGHRMEEEERAREIIDGSQSSPPPAPNEAAGKAENSPASETERSEFGLDILDL